MVAITSTSLPFFSHQQPTVLGEAIPRRHRSWRPLEAIIEAMIFKSREQLLESQPRINNYTQATFFSSHLVSFLGHFFILKARCGIFTYSVRNFECKNISFSYVLTIIEKYNFQLQLNMQKKY